VDRRLLSLSVRNRQGSVITPFYTFYRFVTVSRADCNYSLWGGGGRQFRRFGNLWSVAGKISGIFKGGHMIWVFVLRLPCCEQSLFSAGHIGLSCV
jgi:hypothetical protein